MKGVILGVFKVVMAIVCVCIMVVGGAVELIGEVVRQPKLCDFGRRIQFWVLG